MSDAGHALILNGSPRGEKSVSHQLGAYFGVRLEEHGFTTESLRIYKALRSGKGQRELLDAVNHASLVAVIAPLYIDCLPANVIRVFELIALERAATQAHAGQRLVAIVNCGFPEASQNDTALRIYERFALETGLEWAGGLGIGGGGMIEGKPLEDMGRIVSHLTNALNLSAEALAARQPIPEEALALVRKQAVPTWLYIMVGHIRRWLQARKNGAFRKLRDRPYASD